MDLKEAKKIIPFVKCQTNEVSASCKTQKEAKAFHDVLIETRKLFICVNNDKSTMDEILEQIEAKNNAAIIYRRLTGKKWLL